ncbi:hypothetical protein DIPPA_61967 [Diplonema papillatum]|nr:hypothetical protein DIPPA_61967 [Diplonema papillatum]
MSRSVWHPPQQATTAGIEKLRKEIKEQEQLVSQMKQRQRERHAVTAQVLQKIRECQRGAHGDLKELGREGQSASEGRQQTVAAAEEASDRNSIPDSLDWLHGTTPVARPPRAGRRKGGALGPPQPRSTDVPERLTVDDKYRETPPNTFKPSKGNASNPPEAATSLPSTSVAKITCSEEGPMPTQDHGVTEAVPPSDPHKPSSARSLPETLPSPNTGATEYTCIEETQDHRVTETVPSNPHNPSNARSLPEASTSPLKTGVAEATESPMTAEDRIATETVPPDTHKKLSAAQDSSESATKLSKAADPKTPHTVKSSNQDGSSANVPSAAAESPRMEADDQRETKTSPCGNESDTDCSYVSDFECESVGDEDLACER